jgi:hypothetical protein
MGDSPTTGDVKVTLKLDTDEAKKKVDEVEKRLRNNERSRRMVVERVNKDGFNAKPGGGKTGQNIADKLLDKVLPKPGGYNPQLNTGTIGKFIQGLNQGFRGGSQQQPVNLQSAVGQALGQAGNFLNPFPPGGINGSNALGGAGSTLALAKVLYTGLQKASQMTGLGLAYKMRSGQASAQTPEGQFFNELNSTFSYINNYAGSYKDAAQRLDSWDDAVAGVTGRLPDTQFYLPKFQRQALFERQFADMRARNAALTRAGASGASSIADQLGDAAAQSMSR